ncbi:MAG: hypothetical protein MJ218_00765 [Opitutales bacterium]|nr:hypothetical protein [Opitutales bacterium]
MNFYAFADTTEYNDTEAISEESISEVDDTPSRLSWFIDAPTYFQMHVARGRASGFEYCKNIQEINPRLNCNSKVLTDLDWVGIEVGKVFGNWRFGLEGTYYKGDMRDAYLDMGRDEAYRIDAKTRGWGIIGNVYYTIPLTANNAFLCILGVGLGLEDRKIEANSSMPLKLHDHVLRGLAYQLYVGLAYNFDDYHALSMGYRFHHFTKNMEWNSASEGNDHIISQWDSPKSHMFECAFTCLFE